MSVRLIAALLAAAAALSATAAAPAGARGSCNESCLTSLADRTMTAVAGQDWRSLPWADPARYTENNVPLMIGDAWWGSAGETPGHKAFAIADEETGNVVWFGTIWDHGEPSFGAIRIHAPDGKVHGMEVVAGRTPWPMPFGDPKAFAIPASMTAVVAAKDRRSRERLIDIADSYLATKQANNGALLADFAPNCAMIENGVQITGVESDYAPKARDCASVFKEGLFAPVQRIRDRRFPVVDPVRGLVVAISVQDVPAREPTFFTTGGKQLRLKRDYPISRLVAELVRIEGDKVVRAEGVVTSLPYYMPTPWK
ncbi:MAG TPA: hypothetical protein VL100_11000 [Croceibacterium sp.]|nr:hypothetical protein [Croceibacterium sp.]